MIHSFSILPQHERRLPTSAAGEGRARASLSFSRMLAMIAGHSSPFRRPSLAAFRPSFKSFSPDATKAQASGFPLSRSHRPAGTALFFSARAETLGIGKPAGHEREDRLFGLPTQSSASSPLFMRVRVAA